MSLLRCLVILLAAAIAAPSGAMAKRSRRDNTVEVRHEKAKRKVKKKRRVRREARRVKRTKRVRRAKRARKAKRMVKRIRKQKRSVRKRFLARKRARRRAHRRHVARRHRVESGAEAAMIAALSTPPAETAPAAETAPEPDPTPGIVPKDASEKERLAVIEKRLDGLLSAVADAQERVESLKESVLEFKSEEEGEGSAGKDDSSKSPAI